MGNKKASQIQNIIEEKFTALGKIQKNIVGDNEDSKTIIAVL